MKKLSWTTQQRKVSDLVPYEHNPRAMTEEENKHLTASLEKFGLVEIPVVDTKDRIIAGHQRLRVMASLGRGEEVIDVRVPSRALSEAEFQEYLVRSNKNVGHWDFDMLGNVYDAPSLVEWGFDPHELGLGDYGSANREVDAASLAGKSEVKFAYEHDAYMRVLDMLQAAQETLGVGSKEEVLIKLLENSI